MDTVNDNENYPLIITNESIPLSDKISSVLSQCSNMDDCYGIKSMSNINEMNQFVKIDKKISANDLSYNIMDNIYVKR
jgi:hypothetical protein